MSNIFNNRRAFLQEFVEDCEAFSPENNYIADIFSTARQIQDDLGNQKPLLDKYLSGLISALNPPNFLHALEDGFSKGNELRSICHSIIKEQPDYQNHEFYQVAKQFIDSHPLEKVNRHTAAEVYYLVLADRFTEHAICEFIQKKLNDTEETENVDKLVLLYRKISDAAGMFHINHLNALFRRRFMIAPLVAAFTQGMAVDLLFSLTHFDEDSGRQAFQLAEKLMK